MIARLSVEHTNYSKGTAIEAQTAAPSGVDFLETTAS